MLSVCVQVRCYPHTVRLPPGANYWAGASATALSTVINLTKLPPLSSAANNSIYFVCVLAQSLLLFARQTCFLFKSPGAELLGGGGHVGLAVAGGKVAPQAGGEFPPVWLLCSPPAQF